MCFDCRYCLSIPGSPQHAGSDGPQEKLLLPAPSLHLETEPEAEGQTPVLSPPALAALLRSHHSPLGLPGSARHHHCLHKVLKDFQQLVRKHFQIFSRIHQTGGDPVTIILLISFISLTLLLPYQLRQLSIKLKLIKSKQMKTLR